MQFIPKILQILKILVQTIVNENFRSYVKGASGKEAWD